MKVKYCGMCRDYSGYGEAARHDVASLHAVGVQVTTEIPSYVIEKSDFGEIGDLCTRLENNQLGYQIKILHTTPNVYPKYFEPGKYHIARAFWETDKVPDDFAKYIQMCDEVWTGSIFNQDAMRKAGITKPIYIIPEAIDTAPVTTQPFLTPIGDVFSFYSIFEWTERKNPQALLEAYWETFSSEDSVAMVIKTYIDNFQQLKKDELLSEIKKIKKILNLEYYAPLYIYNDLLSRNQMKRFHHTFDCFVSSHRGEGWGIPQMEALLSAKPIISTNLGGIHEYLTSGTDSVLIPYTLEKVNNSRNKNWYGEDQNWARIDKDELKKAMRDMYRAGKESARDMGLRGHSTCIDKFSLHKVGDIMMHRLQEIQKTLHPQE